MNRDANAGIFKNFLTTKQMYSIYDIQFGVMSSPACRQAGGSERRFKNKSLEKKRELWS
jgi:hypothetical protein